MAEDQLESQLAGLFSDFVAPAPDPRPAAGRRLSAPEPQAGSRQVVILHSHLESARLLSRFFRKHGDRVWRAADFAEACFLLEGDGPGLLLTDWGAPDNGPLAELGELRGRFAGTRVLATDGYQAPPRLSRGGHPEPAAWHAKRGKGASVAAAAAELPGYPASPARLPDRLNELVLAVGYPLVIGLIEAVAVWVDPRWGFALYSLVLLTLLLCAAFAKDARLGHLCLALTLIPTIQVLGLSTAWGEFRFVQHFLILSGLLLIMIYLALSYLVRHFGPASLDPGKGFWGMPAYLLVPLVGMPAVLVTYQALKFLLLGGAPITVGAIAPLLLIGLLVLKELTSTTEGKWRALGQFLNIAIGPLLVVFGINVAMRIADVLK